MQSKLTVLLKPLSQIRTGPVRHVKNSRFAYFRIYRAICMNMDKAADFYSPYEPQNNLW